MSLRIDGPAVKHPDVTVQLVGTDGNDFALIGRVKREIQKQVGWDKARQFADKAMTCGSYDELLQLIMATVEVE